MRIPYFANGPGLVVGTTQLGHSFPRKRLQWEGRVKAEDRKAEKCRLAVGWERDKEAGKGYGGSQECERGNNGERVK